MSVTRVCPDPANARFGRLARIGERYTSDIVTAARCARRQPMDGMISTPFLQTPRPRRQTPGGP